MKPELGFQADEQPFLVFPNGRKIATDVVRDTAGYGKPLRGKQELIAKACGLTGKSAVVLDATMGLGQDTWTLARLGCQVIACEQEPLLFHLFQKSLEIAKKDPRAREIADRIQVYNQPAQEFLKSSAEKIQAIYLDPMFPDLKKSALPKIEMQLLRDWLGHGAEQDEELLKVARAYPGDEKLRVVVKRPLKSPVLAPDFFHQFKGKTIRYDAYKGTRK